MSLKKRLQIHAIKRLFAIIGIFGVQQKIAARLIVKQILGDGLQGAVVQVKTDVLGNLAERTVHDVRLDDIEKVPVEYVLGALNGDRHALRQQAVEI